MEEEKERGRQKETGEERKRQGNERGRHNNQRGWKRVSMSNQSGKFLLQ